MMPTVYQMMVHDAGAFVLHVHTRGAPTAIVGSVRQALSALDPALPFVEVSTLAEEVSASTAGERVTATLALIFAASAALVTAVGLYGLLAALVAQRRREIGIRMALGARAVDIGSLVGRQAAVMVTGGILVGAGAAAVSVGTLRSLLYGVAPSDVASFAAAALVVALVAALATVIPVARAAHVEPADALRQET